MNVENIDNKGGKKRKREAEEQKESKKIVLGDFNRGIASSKYYDESQLLSPGNVKFEQLDKQTRENVFGFLNYKQASTLRSLSKSFQESQISIIHKVLSSSCVECNAQYLYQMIHYENIIFEIGKDDANFVQIYFAIIRYIKTILQLQREGKLKNEAFIHEGMIIPSIQTFSDLIGKIHIFEFRHWFNSSLISHDEEIMISTFDDVQALYVPYLKDPWPFKFIFQYDGVIIPAFVLNNDSFFVKPYHQMRFNETFYNSWKFIYPWLSQGLKVWVRSVNLDVFINNPDLSYEKEYQSIIQYLNHSKDYSLKTMQIFLKHVPTLPLSDELSNRFIKNLSTWFDNPLIKSFTINVNFPEENNVPFFNHIISIVNAIYSMNKSPFIIWELDTVKKIYKSESQSSLTQIVPFRHSTFTHLPFYFRAISLDDFVVPTTHSKSWLNDPFLKQNLHLINYFEWKMYLDKLYNSPLFKKQDPNQSFLDWYVNLIESHISGALENKNWKKEWKMKIDSQDTSLIMLTRK